VFSGFRMVKKCYTKEREGRGIGGKGREKIGRDKEKGFRKR